MYPKERRAAKAMRYYAESLGEKIKKSSLFTKTVMSSPQFFPFFKNPSHFHKFHMRLKTLVPPCPSPHQLKLLSGLAPCLHVSVGYNIIPQCLSDFFFFFPVAFLSKPKP